ncbi:ribosomal maturation YjgA family protein [Viscerimonas tarda]
MRFRFSSKWLAVFVLLFIAEVLIALFVNDSFIRPYGGDVLVVILLYYFVKSFVKTKPLYLSTGVLLFACAIEVAQYFRMVEVLGVQDNRLLTIVLGSSFSWGDILAYTAGAVVCYLMDGRE